MIINRSTPLSLLLRDNWELLGVLLVVPARRSAVTCDRTARGHFTDSFYLGFRCAGSKMLVMFDVMFQVSLKSCLKSHLLIVCTMFAPTTLLPCAGYCCSSVLPGHSRALHHLLGNSFGYVFFSFVEGIRMQDVLARTSFLALLSIGFFMPLGLDPPQKR